MWSIKRSAATLAFFLFVFPASDTYMLNSYGFGGGGGESSSDQYSTLGIAGEQAGAAGSSGGDYRSWPGLIFAQSANTPTAPTISNPANYYNKLLVTVNPANNPDDATFAIAASSDAFATDTRYVQSDGTLGTVLGAEDWQTYTDWGGGSGEYVIGLDPSTTYTFKVMAERGGYTQGPWGPTASAATSGLTLSFDIDVSTIDEETAAPYAVNLGNLSSGSVTTSSDKIWIDLTTNAVGGGTVYVYGSNAGLYSTNTGYTIGGVSDNLASIAEGFGVRSLSVSQSAGGPFIAQAPYNGAADNVGTISTSAAPVYGSSTVPVTSGRGSLAVKAKIKDITPAAADYSVVLTFIATGTF